MNKIKRSSFIKTMFAGAVALHLPFIYSCNTNDIDGVTIIINKDKYFINIIDLKLIFDVLLPQSAIAPSANSLKADIYMFWLLADDRVDLTRRKTLASSINRINVFSKEKFNSNIQQLSNIELEEVVQMVSITSWGETDLSLLMTVCFEAMFANPVYNSNTDYKGWQWLEYNGGIPYPNKLNKYPEILQINHLK
ncbi:MAG: hypothetical protein KAG84_00210 [Bacteroidales bacterium]|nr:hypothetical protein [Bacteroidales bacterium]